MRTGLALMALAALAAGLVYVSAREPVDAPTLVVEQAPVTKPGGPRPGPEADRAERPPSHSAALWIPAIGVRERITMDLDAGPAFWWVTGRPGGGDTVAVAGHRTTHTAPFLRIDRLRPGNRIYVAYQGRVHRYEVVRTRIFPASDMHIADAVGRERLLLTACARADGSPTSLDYRIVVEARPS
jgi:LPXTG-site transpeptidase (sortase) family protein